MYLLEAKSRELKNKKAKQLRKKSIIPAILYGHGLKSRMIEVETIPFQKIFHQVEKSSLIDLVINDERPIKVLIHDFQKDPVTDQIQHIDFYQIKEKEKITVEVELKFIGEPLAVKEKGGIFVHQMTKIKIECLPKDLIAEIPVDISVLKDFNETIKIGDLKLPSTIRILHEPNETVAMVVLPKVEKEAAVTKEEEQPSELLIGETKEGKIREEKKEVPSEQK